MVQYPKYVLTDGENYHGTQHIKKFLFLHLALLIYYSLTFGLKNS